MLMPKRVKRRRVHRGRMKGQATRGNKITYGDYAIQALEPAWITANQIEAARVAMTLSLIHIQMCIRDSTNSGNSHGVCHDQRIGRQPLDTGCFGPLFF